MAEEQILDDVQEEHPIDKRIKNLSDKVKSTSEERDEQSRLLEEERLKNEGLLKERDFLNDFGNQLSKYPDAASFKDSIKEKVLKGYSVEDATTAVLVANGKYSAPKVAPPIEQIAGGSAVSQPLNGGERTLNQLTREEKRAKLVEAERSGDLGVN